MKHTFYIFLFAAAALTGCSEKQAPVEEPAYGTARFEVATSDEAFALTRATTTLPSEMIPSAERFSLHIQSTGETPSFDQSWTSATEIDSLTAPRGAYKAVLTCGDIEAEGPALPCFGSETDFSVLSRRTIPVPLTAALQNAAFRIRFGEWFEKYYTGITITILTESGKEFSYTASDNTLVFVKPTTKLYMQGTAVKAQTGTKVEFPRMQIGTSEPRTIHTLTINASEAGAQGLEVLFDYTMTPIKEKVIELNGEADQPEE